MIAVRKTLMPGVSLTHLRTDKFKTNCLSVNLLTDLFSETAAMNAVLPQVLRRGTALCPDMESLSALLDGYYGARVEPVVRKKGEIQVVGFYADFADDAYVPGGERLLEKIARLLGDLLLTPNTHGGLLLPSYVESERDKLLEQIRARINEKRSYAVERLFELMCYGEEYAVPRIGNESAAEAINYRTLTKHYKNLLSASPIEVFYCGSADITRVEDALGDAFAALPRGELNEDLCTLIRLNAIEDQPRYYTEEMDVTQGKLSVGFRMGDSMEDPDFAALRVMNAVYGGSVTSKLFMNVREKLSLAYYASSSLDLHKGVMSVASGIEFDQYEPALAEIFSQLDAVRDGEISDEEQQAASSYVASSLRSLSDSSSSLEDFYLSQNIQGLDVSPEEFAGAVELVTKDEVVEIARGIECDAVYFLRGFDTEVETDDA